MNKIYHSLYTSLHNEVQFEKAINTWVLGTYMCTAAKPALLFFVSPFSVFRIKQTSLLLEK